MQTLILNYGNIDEDFGFPECYLIGLRATGIRINPDEIQASNIWCPLIWKALYLAGYDIPQSFFSNDILPLNESSISQFDELCLKLSQVHGWTNYAIYCLLNFNDKLENHNKLPADIFLYDDSCKELHKYFIENAIITAERENNFFYFKR